MNNNDLNSRISKQKTFEFSRLLSSRDIAILRTLYFTNFLTSDQMKRLFFSNNLTDLSAKRASNRNIKKLEELKLIRKLKRQVGGVSGGSAQNIVQLSVAGFRVLQVRFPEKRWVIRKRSEAPKLLFLEHTLMISETYTQLKSLEHHGKILELQADFEPDAWRNFVSENTDILKPDLFVTLVSQNNLEFQDSYFFEIDRDTESLNRILSKCKTYVSYFNSGIEQRLNGVFPFVVWLVPDTRRKAQIEQRLREKLPKADSLFQVIEFSDLETLVCGGDAINK